MYKNQKDGKANFVRKDIAENGKIGYL